MARRRGASLGAMVGDDSPGGRPYTVCIIARDPLLLAGTAAHLNTPDIELVAEEAVADGTVVALVVDTFDEDAELHLDVLRAQARVDALLVPIALDDAQLARAVHAGVRAIVWRRQATRPALRSAVAAVAAGQGSLPPDLTGKLITRVRRSHVRPEGSFERRKLLTPRELDVLRLVAEGYDTHEIAQRLAYSERTIKAILHDVTTRLQLRNRSHAVAFLIRRGLL
jgi:DNA-binding NarL/FixJ family response regulator